MTVSSNKPVLQLLGFSAILSANAFVFVPFNLYVRNLSEFGSPVLSVFAQIAVPALALAALIIAVGMFVPLKLYRHYCTLVVAVALLVWLQGNILVWDYGLLDGQGIDWSVAAWRGWIDTAIWIATIACAMAFHGRLAKPISYMVVGLVGLQLLVLAASVTQNIGELRQKSRARHMQGALQQLYRFSAKQNVLHVILDAFQADVFEAITVADVEGARFRAGLNGFVFFKNNLGIFKTTYMSVPAILSGKVYRNETPKDVFARETIGGETILRSVMQAGYEVDLASQETMIAMYKNAPHTNAFVIPPNYHATPGQRVQDDAAQLLDLALFRIAPHFLKMRIYDDQRWFLQRLLGDAEYLKLWYFSHTAFTNDLINNLSADRAAPVYKLLHLMSTHWPMVVDPRCNYVGRSVPQYERMMVTRQSRCALITTIGLFNKMKELGIYDDALIVLMGDHGTGLWPVELDLELLRGTDSGFTVDPQFVGFASPLLAIKLPGDTQAFRVSKAPTSIIDVSATVATALDLPQDFAGRNVFDIGTEEQRERKMFHYNWQRDDWESEYAGPITELRVSGNVYDLNAWTRGREIFSPQE